MLKRLVFVSFVLSFVLISNLHAQPANNSLQDLVNRAAKTTIERFADKKLEEKHLSITLIDMRDPAHPATASFRGNERIYPASVVKLFYLVAAHRWLEDKKIEETPELKRALRDMIVDSSNEATQYVLDVITHTTGGYELTAKEMEEWQYQRNAVNRYFTSLGYSNINVNQKTFCEDAYGREKVSRGPNGENRNKLTTGHGNRWTRERVTSLRSHHKIPVHRPADDAIEPWLNLTKAAAHLGVSPKTLRLAAEGAEIKALHPLTDGPWIFARATLDGSAARTVRERARRGVRQPTGPYPDQQNLFSSMT